MGLIDNTYMPSIQSSANVPMHTHISKDMHLCTHTLVAALYIFEDHLFSMRLCVSPPHTELNVCVCEMNERLGKGR